MSDALVRSSTVHPATGEVLSLDLPSGTLAQALEEVREYESRLRAFKRDVTQVLLARMDEANAYTVRDGEFELRGDGPGRVTYDPDRLAGALAGLVARGLVSQEAADDACRPVVAYKPDLRKVKLLLGRGGEVEAAIRAVGELVPEERRRVSVKRKGTAGA